VEALEAAVEVAVAAAIKGNILLVITRQVCECEKHYLTKGNSKPKRF